MLYEIIVQKLYPCVLYSDSTDTFQVRLQHLGQMQCNLSISKDVQVTMHSSQMWMHCNQCTVRRTPLEVFIFPHYLLYTFFLNCKLNVDFPFQSSFSSLFF